MREEYGAQLMEAQGVVMVVMKEYIAVPDRLLDNPRELQTIFDESVEYAQTLKPKPTKTKH